MNTSYSTIEDTISGLRFLDGRLQSSHKTTNYVDGKPISVDIEWRDIPMITSDN